MTMLEPAPQEPPESLPKAFLGVERSVSGRRWISRGGDERLALAIAQRHGVPELLGRVLAARGVEVEQVPAHLSPALRTWMPPPATVRDMEQGAERLAAAVMHGEAVGIIGDYDVDGVCSSAMMAEFMTLAGNAPQVHIPHRIREGYGPSIAAVEALAESGVKLLITLDCGAMAHEVLEHAARRGLEVIVVDHHQMGTALPPARAVINPNRVDDDSGLGHLCAAGLAFMLVAATARRLTELGHFAERPDVLRWLDLVALATVCDVMPLKGLNRAYVHQGLKVLARRHRPGLAALMDAAGLRRRPDVQALGFVLGPRINAAGRMGDARVALDLLLARDMATAQRLAAELQRRNRERQELEQHLLEEALGQARYWLEGRGRHPLVVAGEGWHPGVLGLVAARLKERFNLPAVALGTDGDAGTATGSARSVEGVDIGRAVARAVAEGMLLKGGGHAMAAGMALAADRVDDFRDFLARELAGELAKVPEFPHLKVDGVLTASGATRELLEQVERAGPFGPANPAPVFALAAHRVEWVDIVGERHVRCTLRDGSGGRLRAIAFRAVDTPLGEALLNARDGLALHLAGRLTADDYNGRNGVQLMLVDVASREC